MAENKKITQLPVATSLAGDEVFEVVQGGVNKQATINIVREAVGDDYVQAIVDTSGATVTLDLESASFGNFSASTTVTSDLEVILDNEERAAFYEFNWETDAGVPVDFGVNTRSANNPMFLNGVFTPLDAGLYKVKATRRYGTAIWILDFKGVYSVGDALPEPTDQWILGTGIWNDSEYWDDTAFWKDSP